MKLLERYIGQAVIIGVFSVLAVLVALFALIGFVDELDQIGRGSYTLWHALLYTLLNVPRQMYEIFPMATLLGTMLGLGMLANNRELVVMRTAGLSLTRIVWAIMKTAAMLILLAMVIGEVIAPPVYEYSNQKRLELMGAKISLNTQYGLWARDGETYINVRRVDSQAKLRGIHLYTFDGQRLQTLMRAKSARYEGEQWLLKNVTRYDIDDEALQKQKVDELLWHTLLDPALINVVSVDPDTLPVWKLYNYIDYLRENGLDSGQYELAMWGKAVMPFTLAAMVLLAVPFVFGAQRHTGIGQQIMIGFLIGIVFYIGNRLAGQMGLVYEFPPALAAALPTALVIGASLLWFRRLR
ncbi:MAG: LPS export ABC transporter permease LptG [Thiohalophilus sp.]|uniref:LPS export ABC transporter permease LptG n=1 Tax=Thiohalophilus sp. TaxID=3028392 RepID=UPI0028704F37|nr:LPS export ABC transporter permease LptG [Thiohalophilus sp.]MDR9436315.1 LPS export ABC transporter permease LptG [Thiohalophilus sp.]